ncbi:RidA family protein [Burkholderia sp. JKS000303]|uniref:RidA family protein n=1 Tax=Burkholderia sp. JKS000303 TaxID=1938747 RepID=UPI000BF7897B|nr:RidA family protein [Burkholderia sp. JKS000303]PFH20188.1 reactive intermediate/imine deaminase [Burkholderia sp. JKS000303]
MSTQDQATALNCKNASGITPPAGHYSHVCIANGFVFVSGQLPIDEQGKPLSDLSFDAQTRQVLRNVDTCLEAAGVTRDSLVQIRVFVSNIEHWPLFNTLYAEWIGAHKPARAVAESRSLHYGAAVEVEAIALAPTP